MAGLLAHTRMKHKMRKEKVDVQGCKFTLDPSAPAGQGGGAGGGGGGGDGDEGEEDEEDEEPFSSQPSQPAAAVVWQQPGEGEPQSKKLKLVFKVKKEGQ